MKGWLIGACIACLSCALSSSFVIAPAYAQEAAVDDSDPRMEQARGLFSAGRAAFENNDYENALRYFRESYELSHRPALLYNIGVAADRLRRDAEALEAFERYLSEVGEDAPQRGDAEARVRVLRSQESGGGGASPAPGAGGSGGGASGGGGDSGLAMVGWGIFGAGAAALVTGVVFLGVGQAEAGAYESAPEGTPWSEVAGTRDRADWMRVTGWVLAGVGLAAAASGLVVALTAPSGGESVSLRITPGGVALAWRHQ